MQYSAKPLPDFEALDFVPSKHYFAIKHQTFHKHFGVVSLPSFFNFLTIPLLESQPKKSEIMKAFGKEPFWRTLQNSEIELISPSGNETVTISEYRASLNAQINISYREISPYYYSLNDHSLTTAFEEQWSTLMKRGRFERS